MENNSPPSLAVSILTWHDGYLLGYTPMDQVHQEFVQIVGCMQQASDAELPALLDQFAKHAKAHFDAENAWMIATDFPARDCHIEEHAAVLNSVEQVRELVSGGNVAIVRSLVDHLASWFPGHADYLDSALSHWMSKRRFGGKPVVLRRGVAKE
jgi:hemerythrin